jgi:phosphoglycerate kinase
MFDKLTIEDVEVSGKRVLVRVDFNVPISESGAVTDDTRIRAALPTIRYLVDHGAKVILVSHLGRPKGEPEDRFRLDPVVAVLSGLLGSDVRKMDQVVGDQVTAAVAGMSPGDVIMLENVRFELGEKTNDPAFAARLAELGEIYVNDAFGAAHRAHASTEGVAHILPAYAGFLLSREVETLTAMLDAPKRPFVAILGGSKVSDKFAVIDRFLDIVDGLLIGGGMCFTFLVAQGIDVGASLVEPEWVERAALMLAKARRNDVTLLLPVDFVVAEKMAEDAEARVVSREGIGRGMMGLDIGPATAELFGHSIESARTIFWNGPMGVFEMTPFEAGTRAVASAIAANVAAASVVGGGDSDAALRKFDLEDGITFISTGGGASMKLLEGEPLPGVVALLDRA